MYQTITERIRPEDHSIQEPCLRDLVLETVMDRECIDELVENDDGMATSVEDFLVAGSQSQSSILRPLLMTQDT